jgi:hypothetical protein
MKSLFVPLFAVLTVAVHADQYVFPPVCCSHVPMHEVVTTYTVPTYGVPVSYSAAKPTEKLLALPRPLEPLAPLFPMQPLPQTEEQAPETIRGQTRAVDGLAEILDTPPPLAQGAVEEGTIDPKVIGTTDSSGSDFDVFTANQGQNPTLVGSAGQGTKLADPLGNAMLLMATAIATIGLIYMSFVAYDYHQRWMQSMTMQNDRYLGGGAFEMEMMEEPYGGSVSFSEGFGLARR